MVLEDKVIGFSPGLNVKIITVGNIQEIKKMGYEIVIKGNNYQESILVGFEGKNFIEKLKNDDNLLVVMQENKFLAIYGPVEENKFYTHSGSYFFFNH